MKKNLFITFEGIDGSGKSTQLKILAEHLTNKGFKVYTTAEPTGSALGLMIRNIFKHNIEADHTAIALLFAADRLLHLLNTTDGIIKKLKEGFTVITDRYYFSSYAYHGTHMPIDFVVETNELSAALLKPDLNIFIDVPVNISMQRLHESRSAIELYETNENLKKVREKYFEAFELMKNKENIFIVDGNKNADLIAEEIREKILELVAE